MERSTIIAAGASGMLVLIAGVGAVVAVGSLQAAGQESLAIGQTQPQAAAAAAPVSATGEPATPLKKPKVAGPTGGSALATTIVGGTQNRQGGTTTKNSGSKSSKPSNGPTASAESHHEDDDDHGDDHGKSHESEDDDDD